MAFLSAWRGHLGIAAPWSLVDSLFFAISGSSQVLPIILYRFEVDVERAERFGPQPVPVKAFSVEA